MPGLLDFFNGSSDQGGQSSGLLGGLLNMNPMDRALLAASAAGLDASGPQLRPVSFGQIMGHMVNAGLGAYDTGIDRQQEQAVTGLKMRGAQMELDQKQALLDQQRRIRQRSLADLQVQPGATPQTGGTPNAMSAPSSGLMNPDGLTPASHMGGGDFYRAAQSAGLSNDSGTLNDIIDQVNQGRDPYQAALSMGGRASANAASDGMASALPGGPMSPKTGGPAWLQDWQRSQPGQVLSPSASLPASAGDFGNLTQQVVARLTRQAQIHAEEGDMDGANKLYEQATKFLPEVNKIEVGQDPKTGKAINVITYKNGRQEVSQYGPKPEIHWADNGQRTAIPLNGYTGEAMGRGLQRYQTPDSKAVDVRAAADRAASGDVAIPFSDDAIKNAAARYNMDGTLPPMGMGKSGVQVRAAILNEAARQKTGVDPTQQRLDQLNTKGDVAARNAAVRSFATGKDGQAVQAANTALNHLDTIRQLATAQKNNDWTTFNRVSRAIGAQFGQTAPTDMKAALIMVAPEISKAVVGVNGTGHERDQAIDALNPNNSLDQIISGTGVMQELFGGRLTEAKRTYERTTMKKDFDTTMLSPAAQAVLSRAQQHANPTGSGRANPGGGKFSVKTPDGRTWSFNDAKSLANFKLEAGIR